MKQDIVIGKVTGTGAAINVSLGFKPSAVRVRNLVKNAELFWTDQMTEGHAYKKGTNRIMNMALTAAGLAIGFVSKAKVKIGNTVTFLISGVFKSKTTAEVAFTATTHNIANNAASIQEAVYVVSLAADGTPKLTMGAIATGAGNAVIPACPAGEAPIGHIRVAVAAGATLFNASTDELDAAHLTVTYTDMAFLIASQLGCDCSEKITANGISLYAGTSSAGEGFTIGADTEVNVNTDDLLYEAYR